MTKCPRCNIEQEESPQCEYCGLVFEAFRESTQASKVAHSKRAVLIAIILVLTGALLSAYLLISYQDKPGEKFIGVERYSQALSVQVILSKKPTKMISGQRQENYLVISEF